MVDRNGGKFESLQDNIKKLRFIQIKKKTFAEVRWVIYTIRRGNKNYDVRETSNLTASICLHSVETLHIWNQIMSYVRYWFVFLQIKALVYVAFFTAMIYVIT